MNLVMKERNTVVTTRTSTRLSSPLSVSTPLSTRSRSLSPSPSSFGSETTTRKVQGPSVFCRPSSPDPSSTSSSLLSTSVVAFISAQYVPTPRPLPGRDQGPAADLFHQPSTSSPSSPRRRSSPSTTSSFPQRDSRVSQPQVDDLEQLSDPPRITSARYSFSPDTVPYLDRTSTVPQLQIPSSSDRQHSDKDSSSDTYSSTAEKNGQAHTQRGSDLQERSRVVDSTRDPHVDNLPAISSIDQSVDSRINLIDDKFDKSLGSLTSTTSELRTIRPDRETDPNRDSPFEGDKAERDLSVPASKRSTSIAPSTEDRSDEKRTTSVEGEPVSRYIHAPDDASDGLDSSQAVNLERVSVIPRDPLVESPSIYNGTAAIDHTPASSNTPPLHVPDAHSHFDKQQDDSPNDTIDRDERIGLTRANQSDLSVPPPLPPSHPSLPPSIDPSLGLGHSEDIRATDRTEKEEAEGSGMNEGNHRSELSIRDPQGDLAPIRPTLTQSVSFEYPSEDQEAPTFPGRGDPDNLFRNSNDPYIGARGSVNIPSNRSSEPLKTKITPKGRGKRKAEQVVQAEVTTGGIPNPNYQAGHPEAGIFRSSKDRLGAGPNMEVQINHNYVAGNAPPSYDEYAYPATGLSAPNSAPYVPGQGFPSPSEPGPLFPSGPGHQHQSYSAPPDHRPNTSPGSSRNGLSNRPTGSHNYNAMAGPSNPYLQGLPPAIQSQMPGGSDYSSLPVGVSGGKIFKCMGFPGCEMTFTRSEHLARHVRKHTGERPFPCHCGKAFSRLDNLRQHAATVHSDSIELNDRMLRALAPVHAALSQRAGKEQRQRGEVLSVPKTAGERAKSVQPKKAKRPPKALVSEGHGAMGQMPMMHPGRHLGPEMPPPSSIHPGQPGFQLHHPLSSSITSHGGDGMSHYPHTSIPQSGGSMQGMYMGQPHNQPAPPPWFPPHTAESQRPESSYRPGTGARPGTGYAPPHSSSGVSPLLPGPPQSAGLSGYGHYGRSPQEQPPGFQYEPFPHGIRPGSKQPVSLQLQHPPRSSVSAMGGQSAASADGRFPERPDTATSPYLHVPAATSAPPYISTYGHVQLPNNTGLNLPHNQQPPRSAHGDVYHQQGPPGTAPSTGRPGTSFLQHQQQQMPMSQSGPYQSSHGSSGHSSRLTGNSSQHSMGQVTHQQIQEIYGNSGATQESPFSYHPPPTATHPPPPGMMGHASHYSVGAPGVPDYHMHHSSGMESVTPEGRKRKTDELEEGIYEVDGRRKNQKTDLGKVATGVFYPGRAERRNSLAISSLITGERHVNQQQQVPDDSSYGNGFYQDHPGPHGQPDQGNMSSFTFGNVNATDYGNYNGSHGSYMMEGNGGPDMDVKPGHHAMDAKARALLDNGGFDV